MQIRNDIRKLRPWKRGTPCRFSQEDIQQWVLESFARGILIVARDFKISTFKLKEFYLTMLNKPYFIHMDIPRDCTCDLIYDTTGELLFHTQRTLVAYLESLGGIK